MQQPTSNREEDTTTTSKNSGPEETTQHQLMMEEEGFFFESDDAHSTAPPPHQNQAQDQEPRAASPTRDLVEESSPTEIRRTLRKTSGAWVNGLGWSSPQPRQAHPQLSRLVTKKRRSLSNTDLQTTKKRVDKELATFITLVAHLEMKMAVKEMGRRQANEEEEEEDENDGRRREDEANKTGEGEEGGAENGSILSKLKTIAESFVNTPAHETSSRDIIRQIQKLQLNAQNATHLEKELMIKLLFIISVCSRLEEYRECLAQDSDTRQLESLSGSESESSPSHSPQLSSPRRIPTRRRRSKRMSRSLDNDQFVTLLEELSKIESRNNSGEVLRNETDISKIISGSGPVVLPRRSSPRASPRSNLATDIGLMVRGRSRTMVTIDQVEEDIQMEKERQKNQDIQRQKERLIKERERLKQRRKEEEKEKEKEKEKPFIGTSPPSADASPSASPSASPLKSQRDSSSKHSKRKSLTRSPKKISRKESATLSNNSSSSSRKGRNETPTKSSSLSHSSKSPRKRKTGKKERKRKDLLSSVNSTASSSSSAAQTANREDAASMSPSSKKTPSKERKKRLKEALSPKALRKHSRSLFQDTDDQATSSSSASPSPNDPQSSVPASATASKPPSSSADSSITDSGSHEREQDSPPTPSSPVIPTLSLSGVIRTVVDSDSEANSPTELKSLDSPTDPSYVDDVRFITLKNNVDLSAIKKEITSPSTTTKEDSSASAPSPQRVEPISSAVVAHRLLDSTIEVPTPRSISDSALLSSSSSPPLTAMELISPTSSKSTMDELEEAMAAAAAAGMCKERIICRICEREVPMTQMKAHGLLCSKITEPQIQIEQANKRIKQLSDQANQMLTSDGFANTNINQRNLLLFIIGTGALAVAQEDRDIALTQCRAQLKKLREKMEQVGENLSPTGSSEDCKLASPRTTPATLAKSLEQALLVKIQSLTVMKQLAVNSPRSLIERSKSEVPTVKDFKFIKQIAKGGYSRVYLARKIRTGDLYAIKVLKKSFIASKNAIPHILAEKKILEMQSECPFVVKMYYSFHTKSHLFLVMEFLNGGDCYSLLKKLVRFDEPMAKMYLAETVLALEHLHKRGVVHRDLKPDNMLISSTGHIKLTDFGLSRIGLNRAVDGRSFGSLEDEFFAQLEEGQEQGQEESAVPGTPDYLAPEVLLGLGHGPTVDWWALGCIAYEFLMGAPPFCGSCVEEIFQRILSRDIIWPEVPSEYMSVEAKDFIDRLLKIKARERLGYKGAEEVKNHPFFDDVDWDSLLSRKHKPIFRPRPRHEEDLMYFESRNEDYPMDSDAGLRASDTMFRDILNNSWDESMMQSANGSGGGGFKLRPDAVGNGTSNNGNKNLHNGASLEARSPSPPYDAFNNFDSVNIENLKQKNERALKKMYRQSSSEFSKLKLSGGSGENGSAITTTASPLPRKSVVGGAVDDDDDDDDDDL